MAVQRIKELMKKSVQTLKDEGVVELSKKGFRFVSYKVGRVSRKYDDCFKDVLFINGCGLPHPQRYRVTHQIEQLESYGVSCDKIDYEKLTLDKVRYFRAFVFYRCPIIPVVEEFIKVAKENNKTIFYDIDDLVFDLEYTNQIPILSTMSKEDRDLYNDGVIRMGKTLDLCEYGIASTKRLQLEMSKRLKDVYINRNVASEDMVKYSEVALEEVKKDSNKVIMGYLSGSITHNDDFKLIMPSIIRLLKKYENLYLEIVGLLDLPQEMEEVKEKIITAPFMDWKELPKLIRSIDINLAPLEDSIFNEAKSENKWTEAALVKIPTIASNVGAFKSQIKDQKTGLLFDCEEEFEEKISRLIEEESYRKEIGQNAYDEVMNHHITTNSGMGVAEFIKSKLRKNICFVLPSTNISGGIMVVQKHGLLLKNKGYDVTLINIDKKTRKTDKLYDGKDYLFVVSKYRVEFLSYVDTMVASMWLTLKFVQKYYNCRKKKYLVQGMETQIYKAGDFEKRLANATYCNLLNIEYLTISKWCQKWLKEDFNTEAKYAPNGIDLTLFPYKERTFTGKIKILIEGNWNDPKKNVDESFEIVNQLDKEKYEIHYLSYEKEPKNWYRVDQFYHKVPHNEVGHIYSKCDILIKTSVLEGFSYPPLEMMATGGFVVALKNGGNSEYLKDGKNSLVYEKGNIKQAVEKIEQLVSDKKLRQELQKNGLKTAKSYEWSKIQSMILDMYEENV